MKTTTMKTLVLGLAVSGAALAQGGGDTPSRHDV